MTRIKIQQQNLTDETCSGSLSPYCQQIHFDKRLVAKVYKIIQLRCDPAHDFEHIIRVCKNAETIAKAEIDDVDIILAAALMHDLVVYPKASAKSSKSADDSADMAQEILHTASRITCWFPFIL